MTVIAAFDVDGFAMESSATAKLLQPMGDQCHNSFRRINSSEQKPIRGS